MGRLTKSEIEILKTFVERFDLDMKDDGVSVTFENAMRILEGEKPEPKTKDERRKDLINSLSPYLHKYGSAMLNNFYRYWAQDDGTKLKFEKQKSWNIELRLAKWKSNQDEYERRAYLQQLTKKI